MYHVAQGLISHATISDTKRIFPDTTTHLHSCTHSFTQEKEVSSVRKSKNWATIRPKDRASRPPKQDRTPPAKEQTSSQVKGEGSEDSGDQSRPLCTIEARPSLGKARENCSHQSDRRVYNSTHKGRKKEKEINKTEDISCRDAPLS
ncbi:hypothetical protein PC116_g11253 [Phytophthora cactorum]|nr:hypothetical protein PC116_g11253 [Phytophthora cactorum]